MRLFGDILPFVGWRRLSWDEVCRRGLGTILEHPGCDYEFFEIEWLTHGYTFAARAVFDDAC